jgi:hypothetical protein
MAPSITSHRSCLLCLLLSELIEGLLEDRKIHATAPCKKPVHRSISAQMSINRNPNSGRSYESCPPGLPQTLAPVDTLATLQLQIPDGLSDGSNGTATLQFNISALNIMVTWLEGDLQAPVNCVNELMFLAEAIFGKTIQSLSYSTGASLASIQGSTATALWSSLVHAAQFGQVVTVQVESSVNHTESTSETGPWIGGTDTQQQKKNMGISGNSLDLDFSRAAITEGLPHIRRL